MNAASALGVYLTRRKIAKYSGTTLDGTSEHGIKNALHNLDFKIKELSGIGDYGLFLRKIDLSLKKNRPIILCVDKNVHWVAIVGTIGQKYIVFDSSYEKKNKKLNGVHILSDEELIKRAIHNTAYYGIIVMEKKNEK
jgi:ABC-type bacteriocin/lantibiotic exporter with double-glycine peptidase domain